MNFITNGATFSRAKAIRTSMMQDHHPDLPTQPYAFLSSRDLRGLVAAMVD